MRVEERGWRRMRSVLRSSVAPVAASVVLLCLACSQTARHKVLTTLFDGVPPLDGPLPTEAVEEAEEAGEAGEASAPEPPRVEAPPPSLHEPYRNRQCTACHDMTSLSVVRGDPRALCMTCHNSLVAGADLVHGPVASGACLLCHHPHRSDLPSLLLSPAEDLCSRCHPTSDLPGGAAHARDVTSEPRSCTECHWAHSGTGRYLLKR